MCSDVSRCPFRTRFLFYYLPDKMCLLIFSCPFGTKQTGVDSDNQCQKFLGSILQWAYSIFKANGSGLSQGTMRDRQTIEFRRKAFVERTTASRISPESLGCFRYSFQPALVRLRDFLGGIGIQGKRTVLLQAAVWGPVFI